MSDPKRGRSPGKATLQPAMQKLGAEPCCGVVARGSRRRAQPRHVHPCPAAYENSDALRRDLNGSTDQRVDTARVSTREWNDAR